jgi:putative membrane protein
VSKRTGRENVKARWIDAGKEPDYRFTLANERTFLAWIRTALAILASGILLEQFASGFRHHQLVFAIAVAMTVLAAVLSIAAFVRWRRNQIAMRTEGALQHGTLLPALSAALGVVSLTLMLVLLA